MSKRTLVVNEATRTCCGMPASQCRCKGGAVFRGLTRAMAEAEAEDILPIPTLNWSEIAAEGTKKAEPVANRGGKRGQGRGRYDDLPAHLRGWADAEDA